MADPNRSARGKSFTPEQDEAICRAYLSITQDPIIGNSQPRAQFWKRVLEQYNECTNDVQRTEQSMKSRWQIIQKACNKFRGCLRSVQALHQSGRTEQDEIDQAKRAYFDDTDGKYFAGMDGCWKILEHSIKWQDVVPGGRKPTSSEMPTSSIPQSPEETQIPNTFPYCDMDNTPSSGGSGSVSSPSKKRPGGRKQAKEKRSKSKLDEQSDAKFLNLMEQFNQNVIDKATTKAELEAQRIATLREQTAIEGRKTMIEEKRLAMEEKKAAREEKKAAREEKEMEDKIMQMDLNMIVDPQLRIHYQNRKAEIMAKWTPSPTAPYFPELPPY